MMKKFILFAMSALALAACSDDATTVTGGSGQESEPATEVYVQGTRMAANRVTKAPADYQTGKAYFYIRLDNLIPNLGSDVESAKYFPQTRNHQSVFVERNSGTIQVSYPYFSEGTYKKYVYDTTGKATQSVIANAPDLGDLIKANENTSLDLSKYNTKDYKIIWYIVKWSDNNWHVDGVVAKSDVKDATEVIPSIKDDNKDLDNKADETPVDPEYGTGNVEVDIHQQAHNTWEEIKTSIHVRDLVSGVKVTIPLEKEYVAEADDMHIRTYSFDLESKVYINGHEYELQDNKPIKLTVEHQDKAVVITVSAISADYIKALRKEYGDGVTIEVHTYAKGLPKEGIWSRVKQSTVTVDPSTYEGLIFKGATNAFGYK